MTKVCSLSGSGVLVWRPKAYIVVKLCGAVSKTGEALWATSGAELDKMGYVNQHGLSRKLNPFISFPPRGIFVLILTL